MAVTLELDALIWLPIEEFRKGDKGTPYSLRPEDALFMPPIDALPRSGTTTVVEVEKEDQVGNCTAFPCAAAASGKTARIATLPRIEKDNLMKDPLARPSFLKGKRGAEKKNQ